VTRLYVDVAGPELGDIEIKNPQARYRQTHRRDAKESLSIHGIPYGEWVELPGERVHLETTGAWVKRCTIAGVEFSFFLAREDLDMVPAEGIKRIVPTRCTPEVQP
jgi:hypothetical protein